jgi:hypothetical protein
MPWRQLRAVTRSAPATDDAYRRLARSLRAAGARLTLATHDAALRDSLLAELGPMDVEMLLGVRPEDHAPLLARRDAPTVRALPARLVPLLDAAGGGVAGRRLRGPVCGGEVLRGVRSLLCRCSRPMRHRGAHAHWLL